LKGKSKGLNFRPFVNLMWNSDPFTLGAGYNRREEMVKAGGGPRVTNIRDEYTGIFGWRPDGFPALDVLYTRQHFYDEEREVRDITTDTVLLGLRYTYKNLDLRYQANYSKDIDKVAGLDTTDLTRPGGLPTPIRSLITGFLSIRVTTSPVRIRPSYRRGLEGKSAPRFFRSQGFQSFLM